MKKLFILILLSFSTLAVASAPKLEAPSMRKLLAKIEATNFSYQERGMVFGYRTIQSCMYVGQDLVIIKNYCYPVKQYPARGFTIISPDMGMIDLYEEVLPSQIVKRDFQITQFPEILAPHLRQPFPSSTLEEMSLMIAKLYHQFNPACWSSNYSFSTEEPVASCTVATEEVQSFKEWAQETQEMTADLNEWYAIMDMLNSKLK